MQGSTEEEFDLIVMGCGLSGMTAAYEILKLDPGIKLCLLEAKGTNVCLILLPSLLLNISIYTNILLHLFSFRPYWWKNSY